MNHTKGATHRRKDGVTDSRIAKYYDLSDKLDPKVISSAFTGNVCRSAYPYVFLIDYLELIVPEVKGHIHADLMAQYAEDAKTNEKPWLLWECFTGGEWYTLTNSPSWHVYYKYRRKLEQLFIVVRAPAGLPPRIGITPKSKAELLATLSKYPPASDEKIYLMPFSLDGLEPIYAH